MKTNRPTSAEMVFILDRSGSMGGLEADTIGGFNGMIESQKAEPGAAVVTTVLFDDHTDVIANRVPLNQVAPLTSREYFVRGCTALLDAVGNTIRRVNHAQKASPWGRPDKTIFVITTDGMENASKHYSLAEVKRMIEKRRRKNDGSSSSGCQYRCDRDRPYHGHCRNRRCEFCLRQSARPQLRNHFRAGNRTNALRYSEDWKTPIEADFAARG
ncbi:MAG: vWA domain-containing protein [Adlercreutzia equolifaciens]